MIKSSGYRISPTEVEEAAYASGLVKDCVALGVEDERLGQRVVLVLAPSAQDTFTENALHAALRERLPTFMLPSELVVREVLPRSPNGKFDRAGIRSEVSRDPR
jgi:acyl-CoA synthetase (AMP-forming)/AMP-acid ligase II